MNTQKEIRQKLLVGLCRRAKGDLKKVMCAAELHEELNETEEALESVVPQLAELGYVRLPAEQYGPFFHFTMMMRGIEAGEKMDRPFGR